MDRMWRRASGDRSTAGRGPETSGSRGPGLGVGVQVYVREHEPATSDDWVGEPTGVIVAPGTSSSAPSIRDDAAINPRASATAAEHVAQVAMCASMSRDSPAFSAPSSQAWMVPSSR